MLVAQNNPENYILRLLKDASGLPVVNLFSGLPFNAKTAGDALESLQRRSLVKLSYPVLFRPRDARAATFSDIADAVRTQGPDLHDPVFSSEKSWQTDNDRLFMSFNRAGDPSFFHTEVKLTLRGHLACAFLPAGEKNLRLVERPGPQAPGP